MWEIILVLFPHSIILSFEKNTENTYEQTNEAQNFKCFLWFYHQKQQKMTLHNNLCIFKLLCDIPNIYVYNH